ncbi:MAG: hypothetical protein IJU44_02900 [Kiritimatiellae bacterium]|nr:hypothetical protein [Kiritimatiellia bacterium]
MDEKVKVVLSGDLERRLRRMMARVRAVIFTRGLLATVAVAVAGILTLMAVDAAVVLSSPAARWFGSAAVLAFTALTAWNALFRPLSQPLSLLKLARVLETRHPEMQERISSAIELCEHGSGSAAARASEDLLNLLAEAAQTDISGVEVRSEFTWRTARPYLLAAAVCLLVFGLAFALWPGQSWLLFRRAIEPYRELDTLDARLLTVSPGDAVLLTGSPVTISVRSPKRLRHRAEVRFSFDDGSRQVERMAMTDDSSAELALPALNRSFSYRIACGHALTAPHRLEAVDPPSVTDVAVECAFPAYTGLDATQLVSRASMGLEIPAGTRLTVNAGFNRSCEKSLLINRLRIPPVQGGTPDTNAVWRFTASTNRNGRWDFALRDSHGFTNVVQWSDFTVLPDAPPMITLHRPKAERLSLQPEETLAFSVRASDDWGIANLECVAVADSGERVFPVEVTNRLAPEFDFSPDFAELFERDFRKFDLFFRVSDNRPPELGGTQTAETRRIKIELSPYTRPLQAKLREQTKNKLEHELRQALHELNEAKNRVASERQALEREELPEHTLQKLEQARQATLKAREQLENAAKETEQTPFAKLAEKILDVRDQQVDPALEKQEQIPLTMPRERRQAGENAERALNEAAEQVRQLVDRQLQELNRQAERLDRLSELARQEEQLAKQAESPMAKWQQEEWGKRQNEAQQRLNEMRDALDRQDAEKLSDQLNQARDRMRQAQQEQDERRNGEIWAEKTGRDEVAKAAKLAEQAAETALEANVKAEQFARESQAQQQIQQASEQTERAAAAAAEAANLAEQAAEAAKNAEREQQNENPANDSQKSDESAKQKMKEAAAKAAEAANAAKELANQAKDTLREAAETAPENWPNNPLPALDAADELAELADRMSERAAERLNGNALEENDADGTENIDWQPAMQDAQAAKALASEAVAQVKNALRQMEAGKAALREQAQNATELAKNRARPAAEQAKRAMDKIKKLNNDAVQNAAEQTAKAADLSQQAAELAGQAMSDEREEPARQGEQAAREALELAQQAKKTAEERSPAAEAQLAAAEQARQMAERLGQLQAERDHQTAEAWRAVEGRLSGKTRESMPLTGGAKSDAARLNELRQNADWMRLKGELRSEAFEEMLKKTPPEYRPLVRQYFHAMEK